MSEGREQLSAKSGWARWAVTVVVAIDVVVLDQWSKNLIEQNIPLGGSLAPFPALEPWFPLVHWTNTGAAFGLLRGQAPLFVAIALVVIVVVLIYSRQLPANSWAVRICLGLMLGGATGNLIDRLHQGGQVTDFLLFSLPVGDNQLVTSALMPVRGSHWCNNRRKMGVRGSIGFASLEAATS